MDIQNYGYTAQTRSGQIQFTYRPLIGVEVGGDLETRTFKALIDSGSDITVMNMAIAELLEIRSDGENNGRISTLGIESEGFLAPVSIKIAGFNKTFTFRVLFVENLSQNFDIILGQQDFFLNFDVTFKKQDNVFYLESRFN